jgi:acyl carrier protein
MDRFKELVAIALNADPADITDHDSPATQASWDSLAHTLMVNLFEEEYAVNFSPDEIVNVKSLADFREMLAAKGVTLSR